MKFNKIYAAMKRFDELMRMNEDDFKKKCEDLAEQYGNGKVYWDAFTSAKEYYEEAREHYRLVAIDVVKETFDKVSKEIEAYILEPVPEDFSRTIEAIRLSKNALSFEEVKAYEKKYENNYRASCALHQIFNEMGFTTIKPHEYSDVVLALRNYRRIAIDFFNKYHKNSYTTRLYLHHENPLKAFDEELQNFLKGYGLRSDEAVEALDESIFDYLPKVTVLLKGN